MRIFLLSLVTSVFGQIVNNNNNLPSNLPPSNPTGPAPGPTKNSPPATTPSAVQHQVIAYYQNYQSLQIADIDASKITHLLYAFFNINKDSWTVMPGDTFFDKEKRFPGDDPKCTCCVFGQIGQLNALKFKFPHLKILLSVGGWIWSDHFSAAFSTPERRESMAESLTRIMLDYGFDGVDIDWEFPVNGGEPENTKSDNDIENLILFSQVLKQKWKKLAKSYLLYVAIPNDMNPNYKRNGNVSKIQETVDMFTLMGYEFVFGAEMTVHNSNLYPGTDRKFSVDSGLKTYLNAGFSPAKLAVGVATYGRLMSGVQSSASNGLYQRIQGGKVGDTISYQKVLEMIKTGGFVEAYDDAAQGAYMFNASTREFVSMETEKSAEEKAKYVVNNGLAGIMIWDISTDLPANHPRSILAASAKHLNMRKEKLDRSKECSVNKSMFCNVGCDPEQFKKLSGYSAAGHVTFSAVLIFLYALKSFFE